MGVWKEQSTHMERIHTSTRISGAAGGIESVLLITQLDELSGIPCFALKYSKYVTILFLDGGGGNAEIILCIFWECEIELESLGA